MIGKTIEQIVPPTFIRPAERSSLVATLKPKGHLATWEHQHPWNRAEQLGIYSVPETWEDTFEWLK